MEKEFLKQSLRVLSSLEKEFLKQSLRVLQFPGERILNSP
jgi:hypothetical protein